jgi:type II secretory pathway pseudopilin PulG
MRKYIFKKMTAFTLIELLIYIAVLSIMTVMVADSFIILNKGKGGVEAKSELNSNIRFVLEKIKRDVASASSLTTPNTTAATSSSLSLVVGTSTVQYLVMSGRVTRQVDAQPTESISSDKVKITNLTFGRTENTNAVLGKKLISVEINISGAYNSTSPDWQYSQDEHTSADLKSAF